MKESIKWTSVILLTLPSLSFAIQTGYYGDVGVGVSAGPNIITAPSAGFVDSGGTLTGGITDVYGLNSRGAVGVYADLGFNFRSFFGIEANYTYWGQQSLSSFAGSLTTATGNMSGKLDSQSVGGNIVGYIPIDNDRINLFAKLGAAALFSTFSVNDPENEIFFNPGNYSQSSTQAALTYGAGVQYQYNPNVSILLSWNGISQFDSAPISNLFYNMASIGLRYTIPNQLPAFYQK